MAVSYRGEKRDKPLKSWLTSPRLRLSGPQCLELDVYLSSHFHILIGSDESILVEGSRVIWRSNAGLGSVWHHVTLNVELPPDEEFYYFVFESEVLNAWKTMYTAAVDNIKIHRGLCAIPG